MLASIDLAAEHLQASEKQVQTNMFHIEESTSPATQHKSSLRCSSPATEKTVGVHGSTFIAKLPRTSVKAKLPRTSMKVPKVPRLPRKSSLRCRKCHACHVEDSRRPWVHRRRQASADIYEGTERATPATQIEPQVLTVSRLPRRRQSASMGPPSSPSFRGHL